MSGVSRTQRLINEAVRAKDQRQSFSASLQGSAIGPNYGYLKSPAKLHGEVKLCSRTMNRSIMLCGGCISGKSPKKDENGNRIGNPSSWPDHEDCKGSGLRLNRRYGRCGKGRLK